MALPTSIKICSYIWATAIVVVIFVVLFFHARTIFIYSKSRAAVALSKNGKTEARRMRGGEGTAGECDAKIPMPRGTAGLPGILFISIYFLRWTVNKCVMFKQCERCRSFRSDIEAYNGTGASRQVEQGAWNSGEYDETLRQQFIWTNCWMYSVQMRKMHRRTQNEIKSFLR